VFLDGNDLPNAFEGIDEFVVGETGFGTGLNFLAVWALFDAHKKVGQKLRFISVEKYPLSKAEIDNALANWGELDELREDLVAAYPDEPCGVFEVDFGDVSLTVYFDDVVDGLKKCAFKVDAWFLDGFKPSSNPEMWRDGVIKEIARLSQVGTRLATFTSVGYVRRALIAIGFDVKRVSGFRYKRHMVVGVMV